MQLSTISPLTTSSTLPQLVIFDLDGTLAESKAPLDEEMAHLLCSLLDRAKVAVISGASFAQFQTQFLAQIMKCGQRAELSNLSILPTTGSSFYKYESGQWTPVFQYLLSPEEKADIEKSIQTVINDSEVAPFFVGLTIYGKQLEDRGSQMTFSAVGQQAPIDAKKVWDPNHARREIMIEKLRPMLPEFQINIGGMTTIDITKKGIDKESGINALAKHFALPKSDIVYVGDALFPGGNDYAAIAAGVPVHQVKNVSDTKEFIRSLISKA